MTGLVRVAGVLAWPLLLACAQGRARAPHPDPLDALPAVGQLPDRLRLGITPGSGQATAERTRPFGEYLTARLRMPVEIVASRTYDDLERLVRSRSVSAAVFAPLQYTRVRHRLPIVPIATAASEGSPTYSGYLVVRDGSPFRELRDLRGAHIAWVDPSSTSGYLYPRALLRWRGIDPDGFFGRETFAADHLSAIRMVVRGEADVASVASVFVDPGLTHRIPEAEQLRVIGKTSRIPYDCVVVRRDLPRGLARRLRDALLTLDSDTVASRRMVVSWGFSAFLPVDDGRYDPVRELERAERLASSDGGARAHE